VQEKEGVTTTHHLIVTHHKKHQTRYTSVMSGDSLLSYTCQWELAVLPVAIGTL